MTNGGTTGDIVATSRPFLSIGEVLDLLKAEFPDVTISKIRFLESQGLLDPERTPSGYRKFYDADVERLRWILRQQRENFLPLKVIKGRLEAAIAEAPEPSEPEADAAAEPEPHVPTQPEPQPGRPAPTPARAVPTHGPLDNPSLTAHSFTAEELAAAAGLGAADVVELERYGLLASRSVAGQMEFDEDAMVVARLAASFAAHGLGPRHLRMYKLAAEREADLYEQVVLPLLKQRNPTARHQAVERLAELARLGESMRGALLRGALRTHTE
jgi:DNA-binding transcriptional MerR regulator